jgi:hypothetical protein
VATRRETAASLRMEVNMVGSSGVVEKVEGKVEVEVKAEERGKR